LKVDKTPQAEIEALKNEVKTLQTRLHESRQKVAALQVVHDVAGTLTSELNLDPLLKKILAQAVQVMQASAGSLLLVVSIIVGSAFYGSKAISSGNLVKDIEYVASQL